MEACLGLRPPSELEKMAHEAETSQPSDPDPEMSYYQGAVFAFCGKKEAALQCSRPPSTELLCPLESAFRSSAEQS